MRAAVRRRARAAATGAAVSALGLLLAGSLVAVTAAPTGEKPGGLIRTTLHGQSVRLAMPIGEDPKGLVLWFHGQGGGVDSHATDPFLLALYRQGWAIAASEYHGPSWGNAASTADTRRLKDWAEERTGVPASLWVAGSMGGSVSLNALNFGVDPPLCWYGVHPAISLNHLHRVPNAPGYLRAAYHGRPPRGRNPVLNVGVLPADVRYRVVGSLDDTLVDFAQSITPLVHGLAERGIGVSTRLATGGHEDPSHFDADDLSAFARDCLPASDTTRATD